MFKSEDDFFFQEKDGIRDLVRSRGLGDMYKRPEQYNKDQNEPGPATGLHVMREHICVLPIPYQHAGEIRDSGALDIYS